MIIVPTPWYAVPSYADVLALDGCAVNVGPRHSATEVCAWRDGALVGIRPVDPADKIAMFVPDVSDAIVTLACVFPGISVLPTT